MSVLAAGAIHGGVEPSDTVGAVGDELPEIRFVRSLPGFGGLTRFVLVRLTEDGEPAGRSFPVDQPVDQTFDQTFDPTGDQADDQPDDQAAGPGATPPDTAHVMLYELRSLEHPELRFLVAVPGAFFPDYEVELDAQACDELGLTDAGDALVLVVLTVGADPSTTTANLLAPVVINARTRSAAQVILSGSDWPVRAAIA
jgi:flagellar assembly factor FliW